MKVYLLKAGSLNFMDPYGTYVCLYRKWLCKDIPTSWSKILFLYGGTDARPYCFGMEQIPTKGDMLFITGGEKRMYSHCMHTASMICFNTVKRHEYRQGIIEPSASF